jgi:lipoate-protein ligase A
LEHADPETLLAGSALLLDRMGTEPVLRWYRATSPALIMGRGQTPGTVKGAGLPVLTRSSGGGAVLLDEGLLSLDVAIPSGHPLLDGDLGEVFVRIGQAWAGALTELGCADVAVHPGAAQARRRGTPREQLLAAICYATLGRGEVTVRGKKVVGLSQRRRRPGALVQCGLLRRWEPAVLLTALGASPTDAEVVAAAIGLEDLLDRPVDDAEIMAAVEAQLDLVGSP